MPFDPSQPFEVEGASTATLEAGGFDPSQPFSVESAVDPVQQGREYVSSLSSDPTKPLPSSGAELAAKAPGYYQSSALGRTLDAVNSGLFGVPKDGTNGSAMHNLYGNLKNAFGGIASAIYTGTGNVKDEIADAARRDIQGGRDAAKIAPTVFDRYLPQGVNDALSVVNGDAITQIPAAVATGATTGAYSLIKPLVTGGLKVGSDIVGDTRRAFGDAQGAAETEAQLNLARLNYERKVEQPVLQTVTDASGLPATSNAVSQVAPFVLPLGVGINAGETAAKAGKLLESSLAADTAQASRPFVIPAAQSAAGKLVGLGLDHVPVVGTVRKLSRIAGELGDALAPEAEVTGKASTLTNGVEGVLKLPTRFPEVAPVVTGYARDAGRGAGAGINAASATGTGLLYGLAGAEPGQEAEGALSGIAMGALTSPLAVFAGGFTRQKLEQATENARLADRGRIPYAEDSVLDGQHDEALKSLAPEDQARVNAARGLLRGLSTPDGQKIQLYVQPAEQYAAGAVAENGGQVSDAANTRGYYNNNGKIFINAAHGDIPGAIAEAVGHEGSHAAIDGALPNVDPLLAQQLNKSVLSSSLDDLGRPTPSFQKALDAYEGKSINWDALSDGDRAYYLREIGAQTGLAVNAFQNPAKFTLKPELSDHVANILGDFSRRLGITSGGDLTQGLAGQTDNPVAVDPTVYAQTRQAFQRIGQEVASQPASLPPDAPVLSIRPNANVRPAAVTPEPVLTLPPLPSGIPPRPPSKPLAGGLPRPPATNPVTSAPLSGQHRYTPAYQDALTFLTAPAKVGGRGMSQVEAIAKLDEAARRTDVPDTSEAYTFFAQTGRPPRVQAPVPEPVTVPADTAAPVTEPPVATGGTVEPPTTPPSVPVEPGGELPPTNRFEDTRPEPATDPRDKAEVSVPDTAPDVPTEKQLASIEREAGDNFKYTGAKPSKKTLADNPNALNERMEAAKAEAQFNAMADAHAARLAPDDQRVRMKVDPDTGARKLSGTHFVPGDAFHERLLASLPEGERQNVNTIQQAIEGGELLNFDYDSAKELRSQQTSQQRRESQAASSAAGRVSGVAEAQEANKAMRPLSLSVGKDGSVNLYGYSPDKLLGNADNVLQIMRNNDLADRVPYRDTNDPLFLRDWEGYVTNQANGYKGDGSGRLKPTEAVPVPEAAPGFEPYHLPPARANVMNLIVGEQPTLSEKQVVKSTGKPTRSAELREFAGVNDNVPAPTGEVNPLRDELNRKGLLTVGTDTGSENVLHPVFETVKPALIQRFLDPSLAPDFTNLRGAPFRGDRRALAPEGRVPRSDFSGSGFLVGGGTPGQIVTAPNGAQFRLVPITPQQQTKQDDD